MIDEILGQYRLVSLLGEGGMGAVYEAVHTQLGRRAAIKVLHPEFSKNQEVLTRFFNEARAVNIVGHPSLVDVYEFGTRTDGSAFIIMQLLEGESLKKRITKAGGKLGHSALLIARQIATALAATHEKGIVHRDLKPENVMLVPDPEVHSGERVKILDFGIAKLSDATGPAVTKTRTGTVMGTPLYMSPEQCRGSSQVDAYSDVYSLGVMFYEMLAGRPPFDSESAGELFGRHLFKSPPSLRALVPEVSPQLAALIHRMLSKEPATRPPMSEVARQLSEDGTLVVRMPPLVVAGKRVLIGLMLAILLLLGAISVVHHGGRGRSGSVNAAPRDLSSSPTDRVISIHAAPAPPDLLAAPDPAAPHRISGAPDLGVPTTPIRKTLARGKTARPQPASRTTDQEGPTASGTASPQVLPVAPSSKFKPVPSVAD